MIAAWAALLATTQVTEARITVNFNAGNMASVSAEYVFAGDTDSVEFGAIRWEGQTIALADSTQFVVTDRGGLLRLTSRANATLPRRIQYDVGGRVDRIPLFTPSVPTTPGVSDVTIYLHEPPNGFSLPDMFPRFTHDSADRFVARPANLPSFVHLPTARGISRSRIADALVVIMLLTGSGVWAIVRLRRAT